jgi:hypothetical protein
MTGGVAQPKMHCLDPLPARHKCSAQPTPCPRFGVPVRVYFKAVELADREAVTSPGTHSRPAPRLASEAAGATTREVAAVIVTLGVLCPLGRHAEPKAGAARRAAGSTTCSAVEQSLCKR